MVELAPASREHLPSVRALLTEAGLPTDGLEDQFPAGYVVALAGHVVGVAGIERYEDVGLLRSVAVSPRYRSAGLARLLVNDRLSAARAVGIQRVFLLTTTAAPYFEKLGFTAAPRATAPGALAASVEFAHACPASATCLCIHTLEGPTE